MKALVRSVTIVSMLIAFFACKPSVNDIKADINAAELAVEQGNWADAQSFCDNILGNEESSKLLNPSDFCRLAIVYKKVADSTDAADLVASSVNCYNKGAEISGDSIMAYLNSLSPSDASILLGVMLVANGNNIDIDDDEQLDSIDLTEREINVNELTDSI